MPATWHRKVKFASVSQLLGLALCSFFGSVSRPFTAPGLIGSLGGKEKKSLLLTLNMPKEFCQSSCVPQAEWCGLSFSHFLWFCKDGGQVWATIFTVSQLPAHILHEMPGLHCPSTPSQHLQYTSCATHIQCSTPPPYLCEPIAARAYCGTSLENQPQGQWGKSANR